MASCHGFDSFYTDLFRLKIAKDTWINYFSKNNITRIEQIQKGIDALQITTRPNPPQLGEFISWCKPNPKDYGLPDFEEAFKISIKMNAQFSNYKPSNNDCYTVIHHAIEQITPFSYRQMTSENARKTFKYYYELSCNQFIKGELVDINKALEEKKEQHQEGIMEKYKDIKTGKEAFSTIFKILK